MFFSHGATDDPIHAIASRAVVSNEFVRKLDALREAGASIDLELPRDLVAHVDAGRSADAHTHKIHADAVRSSDTFRAKQAGMRHLEEALRARSSDLLTAASGRASKLET